MACEKVTNQCLFGFFFSPELGFNNSLHLLTAIPRKSLLILNNKAIGPGRLQYLIKTKFCQVQPNIYNLQLSACHSSTARLMQLNQLFKRIYTFQTTLQPHSNLAGTHLTMVKSRVYFWFDCFRSSLLHCEKALHNNNVANFFLAQP
jgi:hypothetical protein